MSCLSSVNEGSPPLGAEEEGEEAAAGAEKPGVVGVLAGEAGFAAAGV